MNTTQSRHETFEITGDWAEQSKQLQAKYFQLTTADLKLEAGKEEEMLKRVGTRLNKKREEIVSIIRKGQPVKF